MQEQLHVQKLINVICHINKIMEKKHTIISNDAKKAFDKIQHPLMILKNTEQIRNRGKFLNKIKDVYEKPTANILLNGERLNAFTVSSRTRKDACFHHLFSIVLKVLARRIWQEREIKGI